MRGNRQRVYLYFIVLLLLSQGLIFYYFTIQSEMDIIHAERAEPQRIRNENFIKAMNINKELSGGTLGAQRPPTFSEKEKNREDNNLNEIERREIEEREREEIERIEREKERIEKEITEKERREREERERIEKEEEERKKKLQQALDLERQQKLQDENNNNNNNNNDNNKLNKEVNGEIDISRIPQKGAVEIGFKMEESKNTTITNKELLQVIVVPHTHCDAGWLKTFEQYYRDEVRLILDTLTSALANKPHRKFGWVEIGFLDKWWAEQSPDTKNLFRRLINNKQIEMVMGGWVSSDEASVTYMNSINQLTEGHRYLQEQINPNIVPKIGWQIDPFGLSKVTPSLFSQMCFDAHVAWRISEPTMRDYLADRSLEFVWRASQSLGPSSDLLMHLLPWGYEAPREYLFEWQPMPAGGVQSLAKQLAANFKSRAEHYNSGVLMWLWGHDFRFVNSHLMFDTMDQLLDEINSHPDIYHCKVEYGTPSEYFEKLNSVEKKFEMRDKDYFPYWAGPVNWWTGYYTSRPKLKQFCRYLDHFQRSAEAIYAIARLASPQSLATSHWEELFGKLENVRKVQGVMQHHDAITGTMREEVHRDYWQMMHQSEKDLKDVVKATVAPILFDDRSLWKAELEWNKEMSEATVSLFNSLAWNRSEYISFAVSNPNLVVFDLEGNEIESAILFDWDTNLAISGYRLYFLASVPALGFQSYLILRTDKHSSLSPLRDFSSTSFLHSSHFSSSSFDLPNASSYPLHSSQCYLENDQIKVYFDEGGNIRRVAHRAHHFDLTQQFLEYAADGAWDNHYTFKSSSPPSPLPSPSHPKLLITRTPIVEEIVRYNHERVKQIYRIYRGSSFIHSELIVGPPARHSNFVVRFSSNLKTSNKFYTDDSGLEMIERVYNSSLPVYGNYYPMIYSTFIKEEDDVAGRTNQLTFISTNAHGVTSSSDGELEVMLHRNSPQKLANGEAMDDQTTVRLRSYLLFTEEDNNRRQELSMLFNFPLLPIFSPSESEVKHNTISYLSQPFPTAVHLTNYQFHNRSSQYVAVRVNHLRQNDKVDTFDAKFNKANPNIVLDLVNSLSQQSYRVSSIEERTLSFNDVPENCQRFHWHDVHEVPHPPKYGEIVSFNNTCEFSIRKKGVTTLLPLAFHSYFVNFSPANNNNK